ncbi:hypothetical protein CLV78_10317 [Aliiruegeria haliotis]|uniref:Uncharacterized protein n=1 Tax=Aliiruegeria haliotis TaxID=1280846 RepID=A0A2T0RSU0_9RHOB|nr:hypothetical protein [Aliiruegeria haliotis]PRY24153.1 hypothetical protein CLV78_10317 [Aliiruegeria haliotis]
MRGRNCSPDAEVGNLWTLKVPIPVHLLSDGVQTFVVRDMASDETLARFSIVTGPSLDEDIRVELEMLRAELDLLKKAVRHHCAEAAET